MTWEHVDTSYTRVPVVGTETTDFTGTWSMTVEADGDWHASSRDFTPETIKVCELLVYPATFDENVIRWEADVMPVYDGHGLHGKGDAGSVEDAMFCAEMFAISALERWGELPITPNVSKAGAS